MAAIITYADLGVDPRHSAQRLWEARHNGHRVEVRSLGPLHGVTRYRVTLYDPKGKEIHSDDMDENPFTTGRHWLRATE